MDMSDTKDTKDTKEVYFKLTEENEWEGETWYHYFLDEPGVQEALNSITEDEDNDFTDLEKLELSDEEATVLANLYDEGYIQTHWFGHSLDVKSLSSANGTDLYKGGIRNYAEDMFETVNVNTKQD